MGEEEKNPEQGWDDIKKVPVYKEVKPFLRKESGEEIPIFDKRGRGELKTVKKLPEQGPDGQCVVQIEGNQKATVSPSIINNKTRTLFRLI